MKTTNILVTHREDNSDCTVMSASIKIAHNATAQDIEQLVAEFKEKISFFNDKAKKTFSNFSTPMVIQADKSHYVEEACAMRIENTLDVLTFLGFARKRAEEGIVRIGKTGRNYVDFSINGQVVSQDDSDETFEPKYFLEQVHALVAQELSFNDFCKKIVSTWEELSF